MLASRHTVAYKIDFLNNYNAQTNLTFKSFCIENNVAIKTARGWGPQLQIAIKAEIVVLNILDKRCLIDAYLQQTQLDGVTLKQYLINIKSPYQYNTAKHWLHDESVTSGPNLQLHMVHPDRTAAYMNKKIKEWGVFGIENVRVVIQESMGRGLFKRVEIAVA